MGKSIWKFPAPIDEDITISMPFGAEVLTVALQGGVPFVWAKIDTEEPVFALYKFSWRGTGHPAGGLGKYVGTVLMHGGALVFHLFEANR